MIKPALRPGVDHRLPEHRRETFLAFYDFHLRYRSHPGAVYYALPAIAEAMELDDEGRAWLAWLNANTQNPVTSYTLLKVAPAVEVAEEAARYQHEKRLLMDWDTDRRYHKKEFGAATAHYADATRRGQADYWRRAADGGWGACWKAATALHTMGRLSAWSYLEYLRILDVAPIPDASSLMLMDRDGSRSHRNGLALVHGHDEWVWWDNNPDFDGDYDDDAMLTLMAEGEALLAEAQKRTGHPDATYLTLESALCTYKSWHRPRRRYPNVYNDLLHARIRAAETNFGADKYEVLWEARAKALPEALRLEDNPNDPGAVADKQNWYLETGEVIMLDHDWPTLFTNGFSRKVARGDFGRRSR